MNPMIFFANMGSGEDNTFPPKESLEIQGAAGDASCFVQRVVNDDVFYRIDPVRIQEVTVFKELIKLLRLSSR